VLVSMDSVTLARSIPRLLSVSDNSSKFVYRPAQSAQTVNAKNVALLAGFQGFGECRSFRLGTADPCISKYFGQGVTLQSGPLFN
jgi:hypothetical protein